MIKKAIAFILLIIFTFSLYIPAVAVGEPVIIVFRLGSTGATVNGKNVQVEKVFSKNNAVLAPLKLLVESLGMEKNVKENSQISLSYRNSSIDMTVGSIQCKVNGVDKELPAAPMVVNGSIMVPLRFVAETFGASVGYDNTAGTITVRLDDDGALSDLSFLTGGIGKARVGNSYFGWSLNVPKGSKISSTSFNSKDVTIENEHRKLVIEVSVQKNEDKNLEKCYNEILDNPLKFIGGEIYDSVLNENSTPAYAEIQYISKYEEAAIKRIFVTKDYIYGVTLSSYEGANIEQLKNNRSYMDILNSFSLGFNGSSRDVQDISKISSGTVKYSNYIALDKKYLAWEMNVLPEWDVQKNYSDNQMQTIIGLGSKEYISVELIKPDKSQSFEKYILDVKDFYAKNYNPKFYQTIESKEMQVGGYKSYNISFKLVLGNKNYIIDENYIPYGNMIYDIVIKSPEESYKRSRDTFYKMIGSFKPSDLSKPAIEKEIDAYLFEKNRGRVGKDDTLSTFENKTYKWNMDLPGYWRKFGDLDQAVQSFYDNRSAIRIFTEAVDKSSENKNPDSQDKFYYLKMMLKQDHIQLTSKDTKTEKGISTKIYTYRWEDEDQEMFSTIKCYIVDGEKYSYCFYSIVPDFTASDYNLKMVEQIWQSFKITDKSKN